MKAADFLDLVRTGLAPLAERYGLRELRVRETYVYKAILLSNGRRALKVYLDARDGYLDAVYGDASNYNPDGSLAEPAAESYANHRSVGALLRPEGVVWPTRVGELYEPGVFERAVGDLVAGIERHAVEILGTPGQVGQSYDAESRMTGLVGAFRAGYRGDGLREVPLSLDSGSRSPWLQRWPSRLSVEG